MRRRFTSHEVDVSVCEMCRSDDFDDGYKNCLECELVPYRDNRDGTGMYIDNDGVERWIEDW